MDSFWQQLAKPIIGLSPMDGVTDQPFRHIQKKYGNPDVVFTEFTSVEGVCRGADRLLEDFLFDESQRPIIAQIYGSTPDHFRQTATILCELGFDGIDINMGCPAKNVAHSGAGAALIQSPKLAQEIVRATKAGIDDYLNGKKTRDCKSITELIWREVERRHQLLPPAYQEKKALPVSVKTRVGYDQPVIQWWVETLLETEPAAISVHGRTLKQQYGGSASWELIAEGAQLCKKTDTVYLGNGDVANKTDALEKVTTYGVDGVLIGRSTFGNPFVFHDDPLQKENLPSIFEIALEHTRLYEATYSHNERYTFLPMRKHLGWYVRAIPNASDIRIELFQTNTAADVERVLTNAKLIG